MLKKCIDVYLKLGRTNYTEKRTAYWDIVTCLLLKPHKQHITDITLFMLYKLPFYSQSVLFKCTKNFGFVFPKDLACRIHETKFLTYISFLVMFSICLITLFPFTLVLSHY
jgi:hypothetical protein